MTVHDVATRLPDIPTLRDRTRALAVLDAILGPEWAPHDVNANWAPDQELASMDSGTGDEWTVVFSPAGAWVRWFDHESPLSPWARQPATPWPGVLDGVPEAFGEQVREAAFWSEGVPRVTGCAWRLAGGDRWHAGAAEPLPGDAGTGGDPDGGTRLLALLLDGRPEAYRDWAEGHFGGRVDLAVVRAVYALRPLTPEMIRMLDPRAGLRAVAKAAARIGYPVGWGR